MIKNYFLIAWRNAWRNKFYVTVNVIGLGMGLACCLVAYLMVAFNVEFDSYFGDTSNLYRVQRTLAGNRLSEGVAEMLPLPLGRAVEQDVAGVEASTRVIASSDLLRNNQNDVFSEHIGYVDLNFFELFPFQAIMGELASFSGQEKIVLTQKLADKFFRDDPAVGNTLVLRFDDGEEVPLTVCAVVDYPKNISFHYDAFVPLSKFLGADRYDADEWNSKIRPSLFLQLSSSSAASQVSKEIDKYVATINATDITYPFDHINIIPFVDPSVNESSLPRSYTNRRLRTEAVIVFSIMAFLILLLACFNFTNTSIALAGRRLKEIGVRKVMGGMRYQIITQLMVEVIIIGMLSIFAGWLFAQFLAPAFTGMFDMSFTLQEVNLWNMSLALLLLLLLVALVAGIYPALYSTKFRPAFILKGNLKLQGSNWLTRTLLTLQFTLSIALLVGGFAAVKNADFLSKIDMGYDMRQLISLKSLEPQEVQALMNAVQQHPDVEEVSAIRGSAINGNGIVKVQVDTSTVNTNIYRIDANYLETLGKDLVSGRGFDAQLASDYTESILVNETFAKKAKWDDPINQRVVLDDTVRYVIGVVEDVVADLYVNEPSRAIYKQLPPSRYSRLIVRAQPEDLVAVNDFLKSMWKDIAPYKPYTAAYLTQTAMGYPIREMKVFKKVFFFLALLGGLLATAGIFSLAKINVARRNKEIGIRKVLGATVNHIIRTLNIEFVWILGFASLLGGVLGYMAIEFLLGNIYAFHAEIGLMPVIVSSVIIVGMAILTTTLTIWKSAQTNPAIILKDE